MNLLITRPKHDPATHYLFYWAGELVDAAKRKGVDVVDLFREKAKKKAFQSYLRKNVCDLVIVNGHGNASSVGGHDNEILVSVGDVDDLFKDKVVFIRACDAGAVLGPEIMRKGASGFVGYIQPYMFPSDKDSLHTPLKDELAAPILECSNQVGLSLLKGKSAREAHEDSLKKYQEKIDKFSASNSTSTFLLPFLNWNMMIQVCY